MFDKSARDDGTFSREDFAYNQEADIYLCPGGKVLTSAGTLVNDGATLLYRAKKRDCDACVHAAVLSEDARPQGPAFNLRERPRRGARYCQD